MDDKHPGNINNNLNNNNNLSNDNINNNNDNNNGNNNNNGNDNKINNNNKMININPVHITWLNEILKEKEYKLLYSLVKDDINLVLLDIKSQIIAPQNEIKKVNDCLNKATNQSLRMKLCLSILLVGQSMTEYIKNLNRERSKTRTSEHFEILQKICFDHDLKYNSLVDALIPEFESLITYKPSVEEKKVSLDEIDTIFKRKEEQKNKKKEDKENEKSQLEEKKKGNKRKRKK